jgi:hypothetical protein
VLEEGLALFRELGEKEGIAASLRNLGNVAYMQGDNERAAVLLHEALLLSRDIGARDVVARDVVAVGLEQVAWLAVARGQPERAARLAGAAEAVREALGVPLLLEQRAGHTQAVQAARSALGEEALATAWTTGRALALEEAIALALESLSQR